jgi:hypothetical protein
MSCLACALLVLATLLPGDPASAPAGPLEPKLPAPASQPEAWRPQEYEDIVLLVRAARRSFRDVVSGRPETPARYRPRSLAGRSAILHLTLRSHGAALAEVETKEMDLVDGSLAAGSLLAREVAARKVRLEEHGGKAGLEFEWLGPAETIAAGYAEGGVWSDALLHAFEPAAEGIGVTFRGRAGRTRPGEVLCHNYTPDLALQAAESAIGLKTEEKTTAPGEIGYFRFPALHVWQADEAALPVVLVRGAALVREESVTAAALDAAIDRMGRYLCYRQNRDGWFSEEFLPSADRYSDSNSAAIQMAALEGLAAYAAWSNRAEVREAAFRGIRRNLPFVRPMMIPLAAAATQPDGARQPPTTQAGRILAFPGHEAYLEVTARYLIAVVLAQPAGGEFAALRSSLAESLRASQDDDGRLEVAFHARREGEPENVAAAAQALRALAGDCLAATREPPGRTSPGSSRDCDGWLPSLSAAQRYYAGWYGRSPDPEGAAGLAHAFTLAYSISNDARLSDFVFRVLDRFVSLQVTPANCPWPELSGAVNTRELGVVGADTAIYLTALAEGLELARRIGDRGRAERYEEAVRRGARFILQLEVREEACFYMRTPRDARGGVRRSPWQNGIRADLCAEALMSLARARRALFGAPGAAP